MLELSSLRKTYGGSTAVHDFSLTVEKGECVALLGPSGCGKTTTLRMVAGFVEPTAGRILVNGRDVTGLPARKRNIGVVFQGYALFPHMTVAQNVAFGLEMRGVPHDEVKKRVEDALEIVRLGPLKDRFPRQLSGGQQQRVALARAIIINPDALLLDEPLSALDAKLREEVRAQIRKLQRQFSLTTVFVTHDQDEALGMADRIAVMNQGVIEQAGSARDVYENPATRFVANFIGRSNFIAGHGKGGEFITAFGKRLRFERGARDGAASLAVRPQDISIGKEMPAEGQNHIEGKIEGLTYLGSEMVVEVGVSDTRILVDVPLRSGAATRLAVGETVHLAWPIGAGVAYRD
ncbi:MAG: ABC transporter ATP-binding protein [Variibacter sp.]